MERHILARAGMWLAAIVAATMLQAPAVQAQEFSQIMQGYKIAPVDLNLKGKDWALVGLGSYLVNTTGCNDCHTQPNWAPNRNPYLGQKEQINPAQYLSGGRFFATDATVDPPVPICSANITPDKKGMPAGLKLPQFLKVMHTGYDPDDPKRLLKVMPWPLYQWKTDLDLRAMYEYLRAIPSLPDNPCPVP